MSHQRVAPAQWRMGESMYAHPDRAIIAYDSIAEMGQHAKQLMGNEQSRSYGSAWDGGVNLQRAIELCQTGDDQVVPQAMGLLDEFDIACETTGRQRVASVYGAYPIVPEFLTGYPECMRHVTNVEGESMPLRIVIGVTSSGGIGSDALLQRGVGILALAMAASRVRPVSLEIVAALSGCVIGREDYTIVRAKINSQPLDLATAAYALTSASFQRHIGYGLCDKMRDGVITRPDGKRYGSRGNHGHWQTLECGDTVLTHPEGDEGRGRYSNRMRELLDLDAEDVYVPEIYLYDRSVNEPLEWVKDRLRELHLLAE